MKYTEKFFKFPVKLYLTKDLEERNRQEEILGKELSTEDDVEYVIGWEHIDINDICGFGSIFSRGKTLEDVKANGFDATIVYLKYGKEVGCAWSPKKFEERLNEFAQNLDEERRLDLHDRIQEALDKALPAIEESPEPPKKKRWRWWWWSRK